MFQKESVQTHKRLKFKMGDCVRISKVVLGNFLRQFDIKDSEIGIKEIYNITTNAQFGIQQLMLCLHSKD
jgi:hypothetical protein